jgi:hypothetical protein
MPRGKDRLRRFGLPIAAAAFCLCAPRESARAAEPARDVLSKLTAPISWRSDGRDPLSAGRTAVPVQPVKLLPAAPADAPEPAIFSQYRKALERESRRMVDRNPALSWNEAVDEDGYPLRGADRQQRDARRLFGGASNRLMSGWLERLVEGSAGARAARGALEGLRMDVRRGGGVGMGAGPARDGSDVAASLSLLVLGRPRLEVRSSLPWDLKARLEVPLNAAGMRATISRKFAGGWRGTFTMGAEDDERWLSAGVEVDF